MSTIDTISQQLDEFYQEGWHAEETEMDNVYMFAPDGSAFLLSHVGHGLIYAEGEEEPISDKVVALETEACVVFDLERSYRKLRGQYYKVLPWKR